MCNFLRVQITSIHNNSSYKTNDRWLPKQAEHTFGYEINSMFVLQPVLITASTHTDILVAFYVLYHHVFHSVLIDVQLQTAVWWKSSVSCTVKLLVINVVIWQLLTLVHVPLNVINTTETGIYASHLTLYALSREVDWNTRLNKPVPVWSRHTYFVIRKWYYRSRNPRIRP
jgi:hypothetical protein